MENQSPGASAGLPLVGQERHLKHDFKVLNEINPTSVQANQNRNLPKMENQNQGPRRATRARRHQEIRLSQKGTPAVASPIQADFMIILYWNQNPIS